MFLMALIKIGYLQNMEEILEIKNKTYFFDEELKKTFLLRTLL